MVVEAEAEALKSDEQIDAFFRVVEGLDYESYASQGLIELISYRSKKHWFSYFAGDH